jgi:hypothetical protein
VHCIPQAGALGPPDLLDFLEEPRLQRWVGVQYHPQTELGSHYGELRMSRCYDMVVFVDQTNGLRAIEARVCVHARERVCVCLSVCLSICRRVKTCMGVVG